MYQGKHSRKKKHSKRINLAAVSALMLLVVIGSAMTIAYLSHSSNPVTNEFSPSQISCEINEEVEDGFKKSVMVQNTGKTEAFIRVAVVANTVDEEGNITGPADVSEKLGSSDWHLHSDGFYYYTQPVSPNETTGELLKGSINLTGIQVTILAEAIQSEPASAAESAWGVNPASLESN